MGEAKASPIYISLTVRNWLLELDDYHLSDSYNFREADFPLLIWFSWAHWRFGADQPFRSAKSVGGRQFGNNGLTCRPVRKETQMAIFGENERMNFSGFLAMLFRKARQSKTRELRSIVLMQRNAHTFSQEDLRAAAERAWNKKFDGKEDPMYFVSADHPALTVVKAGAHIIRVTCIPHRYADDDEYALSQLPQPEQKTAWREHYGCALLELFNDLSSKDKAIASVDAYASLARLALQLSDPNCTAIFVPVKNMMMPNDGTAEGLRLLIKEELPLKA